jgi:hypothetical protein
MSGKPRLASRPNSEIPERGGADLYTLILNQASENYEQAIAWSKPEAGLDYHSTSLRRLAHAEALIEALEVFNCGQAGGFDRGQEAKDRSLRRRLGWLKTHRRHPRNGNPGPVTDK